MKSHKFGWGWAVIFSAPLFFLQAAAVNPSAPEVPDAPPAPAGDGHYWWKGNLHTHTLWSDGDHFPEMAVHWYLKNGYHFLALSDHNILSRGQRWLNPRTNRHISRTGGMAAVEAYRDRFGDHWVETRGGGDDFEVRLKPLNEFRALFERAGRFLMLEGEEITERAHVIHVNVTNIAEMIPPQTGETVADTIRLNIEAALKQGERFGQPMLPHLNHPNFRWAVRAEDMIPVENLRFFEVYNGHRGVGNFGNDVHIDLDRMWDIVLTRRLAEEQFGLVYGLATDDTHNYGNSASDVSRPGRGWVMVRSRFLTPEHLIAAMKAGDFYSTTGVKLREIISENNRLAVEIEPEEGVDYTIQFIGTRQGYDRTTEPVIRPKPAGKIADITGRWVFVQAVADRDAGRQTLRVYDPEKDVWKEASIALPAGETRPAGSLHIPSRNPGFAHRGGLRDLRFWHRARTRDEAVADMRRVLTGRESGLAGYWRFDETSGTTIADRAGNRPGTLRGGRFERNDRPGPRFQESGDFVEVADSAGLVPGSNSFSIEMWVKTDAAASGWNLPFEWPGGDRIYVGQDVGEGWNFVVTTGGARTDTHNGESDEWEEARTTRIHSPEIGKILAETRGSRGVYEFTGDEIYVRAKIISSKPKENPFAEGEREKAWIQPVIPGTD